MTDVTDVVDLYRAMDIFCLPSLREGFPNVVLEAAACGLPVITTTATGCRDSVRPETGWVSCAGDPHDLARCLIAALTNPGARSAMGTAGREWVERDFERRHIQALIGEYLVGVLRARRTGTYRKEVSR